MANNKVAPCVMVISHKEFRYVSYHNKSGAVVEAKRQLVALEHSNNKLQYLYMDYKPDVALAMFDFIEYPTESLKAAQELKHTLVAQFRSEGLEILNKR